ncbi:MAG: S26 family signal peptidase [Treponema sp.]|jgi:signal peptidase I|nr:S26 family signal peptidase [Treponema sp.]
MAGAFFDRVQGLTESCLTRRRRIRRIKKEKLRGKNPLIDWIETILWAVGVVLLLNQYLFQAYAIPSGSMIDTLLIRDRIFVNKLVFGPELLPGLGKLPSPVKPKRNDVIVFENPSYISKGPVFDIAHRVLFMLSFSLWDIDRDESGEVRAQFLIKRAAGMGGDRFVSDRGEMLIRFPGEDHWTAERDYNEALGLDHNLSRLVAATDYPALEAAGKAAAYYDMGLSPPEALTAQAAGASGLRYYDYFAYEAARLLTLRLIHPEDGRYRAQYLRNTLGWYVPEGYVLPLGDNRDNSRDGRYFGPVKASRVLGQGVFIFWPFPRMGLIP